MSVIITYPFDNQANYVFDTAKVEVTGGEARLKLVDNPGQTFSQDFSSDTGFTYDANRVEFSAGQMRQKDARPAGATFYAPYTNSIDGSWGDGVVTGTPSGGAGIDSGALDLTYNDVRYVDYDADLNADSQQVGCRRILIEPNWSGSPASNQFIISNGQGASSNNNLIRIYVTTAGNLTVSISNSAGTTIGTISGAWSPTAGVIYEIEYNFDITAGASRLFVNGTQLGSTSTNTGTRDANIGLLRIGSDVFAGQTSNFKIHDVLIFDSVQHTTDYTPDWGDVPETIYAESKAELPQFAYPDDGAIQAFTGVTTTESNAPRQVWNDLYWDGAAWSASDGSFAQSNVVADILANIASFPASDTLDIDIVFGDSNTIQMSIDDLTVTYTGQAYSTTNPTLEIAQGFRTEQLLNFVETVTAAGSDAVKYILKKDSSWYYWSGTAWAVSNETYAQSNTAAEIVANISSFTTEAVNFNVRIFLHSDDGSTTPAIQQLVITYDFAGDAQDTIRRCSVYWYARDSIGEVCTDTFKIIPTEYNVRYKDNVFICQEEQEVTANPTTGKIEIDLIENVNMQTIDGGSVNYIVSKGDRQILVISVPDQDGALLWNISA
jgi:hypothetical protein